MSTITWSGNATQSWGTDPASGQNWVGGVAPGVGDIAQFIGTSVTGCISTGPLSWGGITSTAASTKPITFAYPITTAGTMLFCNTSALTFSSGVTITGTGDFILSGNITSITASSADLDLQDTGLLSLYKNATRFRSIKCAYSGKTTTVDGNTAGGGTTLVGCIYSLTINSGNFNILDPIGVIPTQTSSTTPIIINGTPGISGSAVFALFPANTDTYTFSLPSLTITGTSTFSLASTTASTANWTCLQSGNISAPSFYIASNTSIGSGVYNTNNNSITATTAFRFGQANADGTLHMNCGTSTIAIPSYTNTNKTGDS
jgi:hypothetical protein